MAPEVPQVSDAGLIQLGELAELRELDLGSTQVTATGVNEFKKALPNVKIKR